MKFKKLNSQKIVSVNIAKYAVDWDRKVSAPQFAVKSFLRPYIQHNNIGEEFYIPGSKLRLDLVDFTNKIVIEVSPDSVHTIYNPFMHKSRSGFLKKIKADQAKIDWCEQNGFQLIEINSNDLKNLTPEMFAEKGLIL